MMLGVLAFAPAFGQDLTLGLIDPGASNERMATQGYVTNELDWLISPTGVSRFAESRALFFALDASAAQFGAGFVGNGFRAGWAGPLAGLTVSTVLNYVGDVDVAKEPAAENVTFDYDNYDQTTGQYATVTESVDASTGDTSSNHDLLVHLGFGLSEALGTNLQLYWERNRAIVEETGYTIIYEDTAAPSDATLTERGTRTELSLDMNEGSLSELSIEPEVGFQSGNFTTENAISFNLRNMFGPAQYTRTVSTYDSLVGVDDAMLDQMEITQYAGQYYWNGGVFSGIAMDGNMPYGKSMRIALDSRNFLEEILGGTLEIPLYALLTTYPGDDQFSRATTTTVGYDDSGATSVESSRTAVVTTTTLDSISDIYLSSGATLSKSKPAGESAEFHMGVDLGLAYSLESFTKSQSRSTRTQVDNDGDQAYTTAGTDIDTTYVESGYVFTERDSRVNIDVALPLAVSYTPVPALTFHAGTTTTGSMDLMRLTSLTEGIGTAGTPAYVYEQYTDNLDDANSYDQRVIDASENQGIPSDESSTSFFFSTSADFGFTLNLSEQLSVDAIATGTTRVGFEEFSVTAVYRY